MSATSHQYKGDRGGKVCSCGREFATPRGTINHIRAQFRVQHQQWQRENYDSRMAIREERREARGRG